MIVVQTMLRWIQKLKAVLFERRPRTPEIVVGPDGFSILDRGRRVAHVDWCAVKEIFALKRDLSTYDTIRLGFRVSDDERHYEVDEDWPGYEQLRQEIERRFKLPEPDWWSNVAFPPFATNLTTLWRADEP
jgi:hypothetical protein